MKSYWPVRASTKPHLRGFYLKWCLASPAPSSPDQDRHNQRKKWFGTFLGTNDYEDIIDTD